MSVRAYIVREKYIWVNEDRGFFQYNNDGENLTKYVHQDEEYCINITHQGNLIEEMIYHGANDYTNMDFSGIIEMFKEDFEDMLNDENVHFTEDDMESIEIMKKYFEESSLMTLNCY